MPQSNARVAALAAAVAAVSAATTHVVSTRGNVSRYFPSCGAVDSTLARRMVKYRAALAMGRDVYIVPIAPDSSGFPALDMADRAKVDSTSYLAVLCTLPADSSQHAP